MPLSLLPEEISKYAFSYQLLASAKELKAVYITVWVFFLTTSSFSTEEDSCICHQYTITYL